MSYSCAIEELSCDWVSAVPGYEDITGNVDLFHDQRISFLASNFNICEKNVLELGSFEAGHTYQLEKNGAIVTAIEANPKFYLRSILVKQIFDLKAKFVLDDVGSFLKNCDSYDLIVASGILYHMANPVGFLNSISQKADKIFIWTHYFDDLFCNHNFFSETIDHNFCGRDFKLHKHLYERPKGEHLGGVESFTYWLEKDDIIYLLKYFGFDAIVIDGDNVLHPNGPCFTIFAERSNK